MGESEAGVSEHPLGYFLYELHGQNTSPKLRKTETETTMMKGGFGGQTNPAECSWRLTPGTFVYRMIRDINGGLMPSVSPSSSGLRPFLLS